MIGQCNAKLIMEQDFEDIYYGTDEYYKINQHSFCERLRIDIDRNQIREFNQSLLNDSDSEPPRKRRKLSGSESPQIKIEKGCVDNKDDKIAYPVNIILDGLNVDKRSICCYINDIRKDILMQPTVEDKEYQNVEFVKILHY